MNRRLLPFAAMLAGLLASGQGFQQERSLSVITPLQIEGLQATVRVVGDSEGVPHIFAQSDHDGLFMLGYLHAQDRLFQMDTLRRLFSGTLAELLGEFLPDGSSVLESDIEFRTFGLRRGAERSWQAYAPQTQALLQSYADGVNAYLGSENLDLPIEYSRLELTGVQAWDVIDILTVLKGWAFWLSFDLGDMERTEALEAYQSAGDAAGFDGTALFFEDLRCSAPFNPSVSISPGQLGSAKFQPSFPDSIHARKARRLREVIRAETLDLARGFLEKFERNPFLRRLASGRGSASNWWVISPQNAESRSPLLANDPHLGLQAPALLYEAHLTVSNDPARGNMNVNGVTLAGIPLFLQGCNSRVCWGSSANPMDVTDLYEEEVANDPATFLPKATIFEGREEPLLLIDQTYLVNEGGILVEREQAAVDGGIVFVVPRRNHGPLILSLTSISSGISIQYTGWGATREAEGYFRMARAASIQDFQEALQFLDVGSQSFAYAAVEGSIAFFTSGEMPLREDLQAGQVDGVPPFFIRDGTHEHRNEWMPLGGSPQPGQALAFEILPFNEMPLAINPEQGFLVGANNDPLGHTFDNDPLNQLRPGGGIFYLNRLYPSLRSGRIGQLIEDILVNNGRKMTLADMMQVQQDGRLADAEFFVPFILAAFGNAQSAEAPPSLANLAADPRLAEAVARFDAWDFSSPTGIEEGYDPGDDPDIADSVAATIYSLWRSRFVTRVIDDTMTRVGQNLSSFQLAQLMRALPTGEQALAALRHLLDTYDSNRGVGASGVNFFLVEEISSNPEASRDFLILTSLADALDLLAGDEFAAAFKHSTDQDDYRWGRLHRVVFSHPFEPSFNIPPSGGFSDLSLADGLLGLARAGGFETVDVASHSVRADAPDEFQFDSGAVRRFVGELAADGVQGFQTVPGGQSGDPQSPRYADQLGRWLTNQFHPVRLAAEDVEADLVSEEIFIPPAFRLFFPYFQGGSQSFTAFAAANLLKSTANLKFIGWRPDGTPFPANPPGLDLASESQIAQLGREIFEVEQPSGWVELEIIPSEGAKLPVAPFIAGFSQTGDFGSMRLDGAVAFEGQSRRLIFTRVFEGEGSFRGQNATTLLSLANPNDEPIELELSLHSGEVAQVVSRTLPAKGLLFGPASDIFGSISGDYVEVLVTEGEGAVGFELIRLEDADTIIGLNASFGSGTNLSRAAQVALGEGIFTDINLINSSDFARIVSLSLTADDGQVLAESAEITLQPGESFQTDAAEIFPGLPSEGGVLTKSLTVKASGPGVIGDVIIGGSDALSFASALQLETRTSTSAVFGHVANLGDFFTGLALQNAGTQEARVALEVFSPQGERVGFTTLALPVNGRKANTLVELTGSSGGQAGGYVKIRSDEPIVAQMIFGTFDTRLQSVVPPTLPALNPPGLVTTKSGPLSVIAGEDLVYTVAVTNSGLTESGNVRLTDPAPPGLVFLSNSGDCSTPFPCDLGVIGREQTRTVTARFHVPSSYNDLDPIVNTATADSSSDEFSLQDNSSTWRTSVRFVSDLEIVKTGPTKVMPANNLVYTLTISNLGPSDATNVTVTDPTPTGLTFGSNSGDCTTEFPCDLGTVPAGATRTITATFLVPVGYTGPIENTAQVTSSVDDPNSGNNTAIEQTPVGNP